MSSVTKRTTDELKTVLVHVRFIRYGRRRHSIFVSDGRKEVSRFTLRLTAKESQLPVKYISAVGLGPNWVETLEPRQELNLTVPLWLVHELGLSYESNYL